MTSDSLSINNRLARISGLTESLLIPERTRSLLWVTDGIYPESSIQGFDPLTGEATFGEGIIRAGDINVPHAEPSLIWTQLPVEPNQSKLPTQPFYYPTYRGLSPQQRFQYLNWLRDITQPTWLSYVFLYLYGLERHLILGNYEAAVEEIKLLLKHHDIGAYAYNDLALASVVRHKNILDEVLEIEEYLFDSAWLRAYHKMSLTPVVVLKYARQAGFTNTRYIKLQSDLFNEKLQQAIDELESAMGGPFFSKFTLSGHSIGHLINVSLKGYSESVQIPSTQQDDGFEKIIYTLLDKAHTNVRLALHPNTTIRKSSKIVMNSAQKRELTDELDIAIDKLATQYGKSEHIVEDKSDIMPITKTLARLSHIILLSGLNPDKAIRSSHELISSGYRAPEVYSALAGAYIKKGDYRTALDVLMQAKVDYGYDLQWQLRDILDLFRFELNTTRKPSPDTARLDGMIDELVSNRDKSSWAGIDNTLELTPGARRKLDKKTSKIWNLGKTKPEKSIEQAHKLFDDGYRTQFICKCIAAGYRRQQKYKEEIDFLTEIKRDFEYYDFDSTLRQALRLLEKSGESF